MAMFGVHGEVWALITFIMSSICAAYVCKDRVCCNNPGTV